MIKRFVPSLALLLAALALAVAEFRLARDAGDAELVRTLSPDEYAAGFTTDLLAGSSAVAAKRVRLSAPLENAWLNVTATVLTAQGAPVSSARLYLDHFAQRRHGLPWAWGLPMASAVLNVPSEPHRIQLQIAFEPAGAEPPPLRLEILPPVRGSHARLLACAILALLGIGLLLRALTGATAQQKPRQPRHGPVSALAMTPARAGAGAGGTSRGERLQFIDGLRGIAALGVLLCHLFVPAFMPGVVLMENAWGTKLPELFRFGAVGVEVFFVLSGFVIASAIGRQRVTAGFVARFLGRRFLRLGPPYYAALILAVLVNASWLADSLHAALPSFQSWKGFAINALYLHDLLGYRSPFGTVAWTLCLEFQFYIVLVVGTGLSQWIGGWFVRPAARTDPGRILWWLWLGGLGVASFAAWHPDHGNYHFLGTWFRFFLGVMVYRCLAARANPWPSVALLVGLAVFSLAHADARGITAALTAGLILTAGGVGAMGRWLTGRVWQLLGRISYSLYIFHTILAFPLLGWIWARLPQTPETAALLVVLGVLLAVATSWCMYAWLERPSVALSHRVRYPGPPSVATTDAAAGPPAALVEAMR